jgi:16S rRNA G966 N2-methylase RsmD
VSVAPAPEPPEGSVTIHQGDNLEIAAGFADASFTLIYLDPPFNTGRVQGKALETAH